MLCKETESQQFQNFVGETGGAGTRRGAYGKSAVGRFGTANEHIGGSERGARGERCNESALR